MYILGISAFYHDSAASLIKDGAIIAAAEEERFTRKKHDASFPARAIAYCLAEAGITPANIDMVAFYEKPIVKFDRILESAVAIAPAGARRFMTALPLWLKQRLHVETEIRKKLPGFHGEMVYPTHHESHAASAFYPSPFDRAAILTLDAVGEWNTAAYGIGEHHRITMKRVLNFPHSLGLLYSAFTYYTGFRVNSGEYKVMGLAPYGVPRYRDLIFKHLVDLKSDGSFRLNLDYFDYIGGQAMTNHRFHDLFGGLPRAPESPLDQRHMDLAASVQQVTEEIMIAMARHVVRETGLRTLVMAGGVALNCVANGRLLREKVVDELWVQPAATDSGGSLGAALWAWHQHLGNARPAPLKDAMSNALLGPSFTDEAITRELDALSARYRVVPPDELPAAVADLIAQGKVVGWFQGRMEFGPRALGSRSILGDARNPEMQRIMNVKIKFRESFRPFAPSILEERASEYFAGAVKSPYMLLTFPLLETRRIPPANPAADGLALLNQPRSDVPAITHIDYSARIQTVNAGDHPLYHRLILAFAKRTGCPLVINTSFNVRGEPIVQSPTDAYRCFMRTDMDALAIGNMILEKTEQPASPEDDSWKQMLGDD